MKKVTVEMLDKLEACEHDTSLFILYFGEEAEVTLENCLACVELCLDLDWFAEKVLPATAWSEYEKAIATALSEYQKATAPALSEYQKATAPALSEYRKSKATALSEYKKAKATAWLEYKKSKATALCNQLAKAEGSK